VARPLSSRAGPLNEQIGLVPPRRESVVALGYTEDITISIIARNVGTEDVRLVTIRDVEPYIEGRRRLLEPPSEASNG
jgi:hypothetical protein